MDQTNKTNEKRMKGKGSKVTSNNHDVIDAAFEGSRYFTIVNFNKYSHPSIMGQLVLRLNQMQLAHNNGVTVYEAVPIKNRSRQNQGAQP